MYIYEKEKMPIPVINGHEDWTKLYDTAWETAFKKVEYVDKPGWKPQLTCMPGSGIIWQWDSCFMTFITNYSNHTLTAFNNLDNLYRLQRKSDGYMSMAYMIETEDEAYGERINPPLMAWAEWERYCISGDAARFASVFPVLEGIYSFIENNRRRDCGLYWFEDPGSSGMDNAPRGGYHAEYQNGSDICYVDLACQQALSAKYLSMIAHVLGNAEKRQFYADEHKRICELVNRYHWCEKKGWYYDLFVRTTSIEKANFVNSKTVAAFWAILCGCATGERLEKMVTHMFSEEEFYTPVPFASISKDDANYDEKGGYWVGGVWPPTNYTAIRGLYEAGYQKLARQAAMKFLDAMCKVAESPDWGGIWEAYAPESYAPSTDKVGEIVRADFVGWGGLAPIPVLIEYIIGLQVCAPQNTVSFTVYPDAVGGIRNLEFSGGKISVVCTEYVPEQGKSRIETEAEKPFTLLVKTEYLEKSAEIEVPCGKHVFYI